MRSEEGVLINGVDAIIPIQLAPESAWLVSGTVSMRTYIYLNEHFSWASGNTYKATPDRTWSDPPQGHYPAPHGEGLKIKDALKALLRTVSSEMHEDHPLSHDTLLDRLVPRRWAAGSLRGFSTAGPGQTS